MLRTVATYYLFGAGTAALYGVTLPISGLFVLWYNERILQRWPLWQGLVAPRKRTYYLKRMAGERTELEAELDELKRRYADMLGRENGVDAKR